MTADEKKCPASNTQKKDWNENVTKHAIKIQHALSLFPQHKSFEIC